MSSQLEESHSKNRNFICSCQKAYLSYAALFTHIKQKHGGKAPGQIVRPRSLNKRGRPRKSEKPSSQKISRGESYNGFTNNNNLKNTNIVDGPILSQNLSAFKTVLGRGFTSYKNDHCPPLKSLPFKRSDRTCQPSVDNNESMREILKQFQEENMEFANPNNQLSSNTLALASIIIGLQQVFKDVDCLELVRDDRLEAFSSYLDIKRYHSLKLLQNSDQKHQQDVFILGNIICAFLNFCHQTLDNKAAYQQIVLLMVCLLDHIKEKKSGSILISCRKEVIHECLPSFFQQYLDRVIIKSKLNFWIFKGNNSFKVLIWFLNWLSAIEANYLKNNLIQDPIQQFAQEEEMEDGQGVEFEDLPFMGEAIKKERLSVENKTRSSIEKKQSVNLSKEESDFSQSVKSCEQEKIEGDINQQQQQQDAQFDSNLDQSQQNRIIGLERLSSEVR